VIGKASSVPHPQPSISELQRKARSSVIALVLRTAAIQVSTFGGEIYLRRLLQPADFGAFIIAQFALTLFTQFGNAGLGGALIQKEHEPTERELSSIWWLQIGLAGTVALLMWLSAPFALLVWPDLSQDAVWLMRALSISLVLTALRVVPTMLMERHLNYGRLALMEVLLVIPYYAVAIVLARQGMGVTAFAMAVLVQGTCGVLGAFLLRPWKPSLVFDLQAIRPILKFGANYQLKHVISLLFGAVAPVFGGRVLGQTQLGFIDWAQRTAYFPLRLVEVMARVSFPLYSRLQHDRAAVAKALERSVQISAIGTLFFVGLVLGLGPSLVQVVYTTKWMPALPLLYVYAVGISIMFLSPLVFPVFDAAGRTDLSVRFTIGWTVGILVLAPLMALKWGAMGFALGYCIPSVLGNIGIVITLKHLVPGARFWIHLRPSLMAGSAIAIVGFSLPSAWTLHPLGLLVSILTLAGLFLGVVGLLDRAAISEIRNLIRSKKP
jgi:O-antigen/teichoic acid export membrane protein